MVTITPSSHGDLTAAGTMVLVITLSNLMEEAQCVVLTLPHITVQLHTVKIIGNNVSRSAVSCLTQIMHFLVLYRHQ